MSQLEDKIILFTSSRIGRIERKLLPKTKENFNENLKILNSGLSNLKSDLDVFATTLANSPEKKEILKNKGLEVIKQHDFNLTCLDS